MPLGACVIRHQTRSSCYSEAVIVKAFIVSSYSESSYSEAVIVKAVIVEAVLDVPASCIYWFINCKVFK